jgi:acetylglutamate kinase
MTSIPKRPQGEALRERAAFLAECLPYLRQFSGRTIVIKYGGHAMTDEALKISFARNVSLLKYVGIKPVIVHGGGPQINRMLERLHIKSTFVNGLRVTDDQVMEVVEMVLCGQIGKDIVNLLNQAGARAVGLSGKDACLLRARKAEAVKQDAAGAEAPVDLGWVGEVAQVETGLLHSVLENGFIPVIAPIGVDEAGRAYNINADSAAGAVAAALRAERFLSLTDVPGVLDREQRLIPSLSVAETEKLCAEGVISGGMIPKVRCCLEAVRGGAKQAVILDGRTQNCLLLELFTDQGIGTEIKA